MRPIPAFDVYIATARARCAPWRLALGLAVIVAVYLGGNLGALALVGLFRGGDAAATLGAGMAVASTPATALLLLSSFVPMIAGVVLAVWLVHRRGPLTLLGPPRQAALEALRGALTVLAVYAPVLAIWALALDSVPNLPMGLWLALLPLALIGVAVQTLAEEMLFRGYLVQQLAARFARPLIWAGLPALAFAALHYDPVRMGPAAPVAVVFALIFALIATDLTARSGTLGLAWGAHLANNTIAITGLATGSTLSGLALRVTPYGPEALAANPWLMLADIVPLLAAWLLLRRRSPA